MTDTMQNEKLAAIGAKGAEDFQDLFRNAADDILQAIIVTTEEAEKNSQPAKFNIAFTIRLNLDKNAMQSSLRFGSNRKYTAEGAIPDPNQIPLPLEQPKTQTEN